MNGLYRYGFFFAFIISALPLKAALAGNEPFDLEPIVVSKGAVHLKKPYTVTAEELQNLPQSSLVEALSNLPIDVQSRSPHGSIQSDFSLRGSNFQGVLILVDGQRINDPQTGHFNADIPFTKEDVERIEVIPGVSSSVFGPDAIGGAIHIITKKPQKRKAVVESSYGQYHSVSGLYSITEKKGDLGVRVSLENSESDGFRYDTDFKKFTVSSAFFAALPFGEWEMSAGYQEKEFGAFDFYTPGSNFPSKEWTKTYLVNTGLTVESGLLVKPNLLYRRHYDKFMLDKTGEKSRFLNQHRSDMLTPQLYLQKEFEGPGTVGLGFEYGDERIDSTGLGRHIRSHRSIFIDDSKTFGKNWQLGLSARCDDYDGFDPVNTGSVDMRYGFSETQAVRVGLARSMRVASFTELFYNDPTTEGDAGLNAEKATGVQAGYEYHREKFSAGLTLFSRKEDDVIDWVKLSPSQAKWKAVNISKADCLGIEQYAKCMLGKYVQLDLNYAYVNRRVHDQEVHSYKYGPNYARHLANTLFRFQLPFGVQTVGFTYKKKPSRRGWWLVDTSLSRQINKHAQVFVRASNLFNVEYQEIEGIPQPGRWAEAGIRFEW